MFNVLLFGLPAGWFWYWTLKEGLGSIDSTALIVLLVSTCLLLMALYNYISWFKNCDSVLTASDEFLIRNMDEELAVESDLWYNELKGQPKGT